MTTTYPPSELIINEDGSIFHLHIKPEQLADRIILVGDPSRVHLVASHFDSHECEITNREFHTITGSYKGKRITVMSTGIGCDNIDIAVSELDALANINFKTRQDHPKFRQLTLVRIGTCGGLQPETPIGTFVASVKSIGFDGLLNYYADRNKVCDLDLEKAFVEHMHWNPQKGAPYVATADPELIDRIAGKPSATEDASLSATAMVRGITIACGGFYGPQGRKVRAAVSDPDQNEKVESFSYQMERDMSGMTCRNGKDSSILKICNFEMESSALAGLSSILGHKAATFCMVIANRHAKDMNTEYKNKIDDLIRLVLNRI